MKRVMIFLLTLLLTALILPGIALALSPDQYALQVIQRDLPQAVRWFGEVGTAGSKTQAEVYSIYQSALPEAQKNHQQGISVKGSVERMLLLLEGSRYFEQVQRGSLDFQNKKETTMRILQGAKDQLDRTQFGEDPQVLLEEWFGAVAGMGDPAKFSADVIEVFTELQRLLSDPVMIPVTAKVDATSADDLPNTANVASTEAVATDGDPAAVSAMVESGEKLDQSFELQRFSSYLQSVESGSVANECQAATVWQTDRAESCTKDDPIECDRNYARSCKKLQ